MIGGWLPPGTRPRPVPWPMLCIGRIDDPERRRAALDQRQRRAHVVGANDMRRDMAPRAQPVQRRLAVFAGRHASGSAIASGPAPSSRASRAPPRRTRAPAPPARRPPGDCRRDRRACRPRAGRFAASASIHSSSAETNRSARRRPPRSAAPAPKTRRTKSPGGDGPACPGVGGGVHRSPAGSPPPAPAARRRGPRQRERSPAQRATNAASEVQHIRTYTAPCRYA